jgi:hypothetical protein
MTMVLLSPTDLHENDRILSEDWWWSPLQDRVLRHDESYGCRCRDFGWTPSVFAVSDSLPNGWVFRRLLIPPGVGWASAGLP